MRSSIGTIDTQRSNSSGELHIIVVNVLLDNNRLHRCAVYSHEEKGQLRLVLCMCYYMSILKLIPNASLIYASTTLKNTMISIIIDDYVSNYTADYIININNVVI